MQACVHKRLQHKSPLHFATRACCSNTASFNGETASERTSLLVRQRMQRAENISQDNRIKRGKDEDRFYCPYPGCTRSFAELWRLKVHYRAPPDVRGSGKERGHGTELQFCPKCGKELKPGKHHVGCFAGRAGIRQPAKRPRDAVSSAVAVMDACVNLRMRSARGCYKSKK